MVKEFKTIRHNDIIDELPPIKKSIKRKRSIAHSILSYNKDLDLLDAFDGLTSSAKKQKHEHSKSLTSRSQKCTVSDVNTMPADDTSNDKCLTSKVTTNNNLLVAVANSVPDSYKSIFDFTSFNKMQSEAFPILYQSENNVVVGAPTGSGKTVLFEMAIIQCLTKNAASLNSLKIIYMAPTKALCQEKYSEWQSKFKKIKVGLLTSDTVEYEEHSFYDLNLILCTPEKLDFLSRRWNNYKKAFMTIKLCLVDEIHTINQNRGAVLEAVITRIKKLNSKIRIIAVSATVPNICDIKEWLTTKSKKCELLTFDQSYRPVQLKKIIEALPIDSKNSFQQEKIFISKVPGLIKKYSNGNSTLIFCATRNSTQQTAKLIAQNASHKCTSNNIEYIEDESLKLLCYKGIAFHHAGISLNDRKIIENLFRDNKIFVLCSTSTLAIGVNINCYLVIIKGTKHWSSEGEKEYCELDIQQMIGRSGRPGKYEKGVAVILTTKDKEKLYNSILKCDSPIESSIHFQFLEHICSEIEIGSIDDIETCKEWIALTYFFTRYKKNPSYYNIIEKLSIDTDGDLIDISKNIFDILLSSELITFDKNSKKYTCSEYGKTMCRNYLSFKSINILKAPMSDYSINTLLKLVSRGIAENYSKNIKNTEKIFLRTLNTSPKIKYPLLDKNGSNKKFLLSEYWQKVYLLLQFQLDSIEILNQDNFIQIKSSILQDLSDIWKNATRIIVSLCDIMIFQKKGEGLFNSLYLKRSLNGKAWDDGLKTILQIESLGLQSIKSLKAKNIRNLSELQALKANKLEFYLGLKPGKGYKLKDKIMKLPQLKLSAKCLDTVVASSGKCLSQIEVSIMSLTKQIQKDNYSQNHTVEIMIKNSQNDLCDYRKISFSKIMNNKTFVVPVKLKSQIEYFSVSASVEKIAGSNRAANIYVQCPKDLKHFLPSHTFDMTFEEFDSNNTTSNRFEEDKNKDIVNMLSKAVHRVKTENTTLHISDSENTSASFETSRNKLSNGNYTCHHTCKNKNDCRHLCCHQGIPKSLIKKTSNPGESNHRDLLTISTPKSKPNHNLFDFYEPSELEIDEQISVLDIRNTTNSSASSWGDTELEKYVLKEKPKEKETKHNQLQKPYNPQDVIREMEMDLLSCNSTKKKSLYSTKSTTDFFVDFESDVELDTSRIVNKIKEYSFENCEQSSFISNNNSVVIYNPQYRHKYKQKISTENLPKITRDEFHEISLTTESYDDRIKDYGNRSCNLIKPKADNNNVNKEISRLKDISFNESDFSFEMPKVNKAKEIKGLEFLASDIEVYED
ncbi:uncharacterized protein HGUI_01662 [Hanseniaspora guilliermondii]|uniref:ATP-dependent DNA helicase MER3 n=1 Tax=Hanseniaspora guilliermondii TaxID=56406 RepID=A0A1L0FIN4_9ASCO|nr:uncharacterized protein HGUI_01662 [Hanseniaspora guilliermondii]